MLFHLYLLGKISKKRFYGTARVLVYGTTVALGLGALTVKSAVASVGEQSLELGRKLEGLQDLVHGAQQFRLNGESVYFSASKTDESVHTVLDRFDQHCNASRAFDPVTWQGLGDKAQEAEDKLEKGGVNRYGVLRKEDSAAQDGVVMCFTKSGGAAQFLTGLQGFVNTGDLHDLGDFRYVHAVRKGTRTYLQVMWTDGSFNIRKIMGEDGKDSVGSDYAGLPRPLHATRTITAEALNTPYSARVYETSDAPDVVLQAYTNKMYDLGWSSVRSPDVSMDKTGVDGRYFVKPESGEQVVVSVSKDVSRDKTMFVVGALGTVPSTAHLEAKAQVAQ